MARHVLTTGRCRVVVLDTGVAADPTYFGVARPRTEPGDATADGWRDYDFFDTGGFRSALVSDGRIDSHAGHGTFVAGIVERLSAGADIRVRSVLSSFGDGDDATLAAAIDDVLADDDDRRADLPGRPDNSAEFDDWRAAVAPTMPGIINMSLIGYTEDDRPPPALAGAIRRARERGWLIVASAGNDSTCRRAYPAALRDVVSVGALGPTGPAPFSNYGPWVRACAPGVELVSRWFDFGTVTADDQDAQAAAAAVSAADADEGRRAALREVLKESQSGDGSDAGAGAPAAAAGEGDLLAAYREDAADRRGWVRWSGTSFSAPVVTGLIAREAMLYKDDDDDDDDDEEVRQARALDEAVFRLIDDPHLFRLPMMGTVVNAHL